MITRVANRDPFVGDSLVGKAGSGTGVATLDMLATEAHFAEHMLPIWDALPFANRGAFVLPQHMTPAAARLGIRRGHPISDAVLVASYTDLKKARAYGYQHIARIEHGAGQHFVGTDHPSYAGGRDAGDVGLFLTPSSYCADRWRAAYPDASVAVVGCPKNDRPPIYRPSDPPVVVVSFHWGGTHIPEAGSAWEDFAEAVVALRDDRRFRLAVHAHPRIGVRAEGWARRNRLEFIPTFAEVLQVAAAYVCDGVSTLYEFAATDRPVVVLNAAAYRPHVEHGLRFWREATVGVQVDVGDDLGAAIELALSDPPEQKRRRRASVRRVYEHRGDAAQRAAAALASWLRPTLVTAA